MSDRRVAAAKNMAVRQRNYRRARDRALVKLAQLYPEIYKDLLEREKANDEAQGRKWLDIDGTTSSMDIRSTATDSNTKASNLSSNQSNYGGEA